MKSTRPERISTVVDGHEVIGEIILRTRNDIEVRLSGSLPLTTGMHIPYFAMQFQNYQGELGDQTARTLLAELHRRARVIEENRERITSLRLTQRKELERLDNRLRELELQQRTDRRLLRQRFRSGELTQRDYQTALEAHRRNIAEVEELKSRTENAFSELIPDIPADDWEQVIALLRLDNAPTRRSGP